MAHFHFTNKRPPAILVWNILTLVNYARRQTKLECVSPANGINYEEFGGDPV